MPMNCPKCSSAEIDENGNCRVCGFETPRDATQQEPQQAEAAAQLQAATAAGGGMPAADEPQAELPEWRLELSRRLQEIRSKREAGDATSPESQSRGVVGAGEDADEAPEARTEEPSPAPLRLAVPRRPRRTPRAVSRDAQPGDTVKPAGAAEQAPTAEAEPEFQIPKQADVVLPAADVLIRPPAAASPTPDQPNVQSLIDEIRMRQATSEKPIEPVQESKGIEARLFHREEPRDDRLILLSRTLAGLVDLIIVVFCASSCVFAVDVLEGIEVFDAVSILNYALLLLATYFVYSLFFLGTARQTIGMMLTDLRVVGASFSRPKANQILVRCLVFLIGLGAAGAGLLWGCFDRECRCLHDRLSGTRVERASL